MKMRNKLSIITSKLCKTQNKQHAGQAYMCRGAFFISGRTYFALDSVSFEFLNSDKLDTSLHMGVHLRTQSLAEGVS